MALIGPSITHVLDEGLAKMECSIHKRLSNLERQWSSFNNDQAALKPTPDDDMTPVKAMIKLHRELPLSPDPLCSCSANRPRKHDKSCFRSFQHKEVHIIARRFRIFNLLMHFRLEVQRNPFAFARDLNIYPNFSMRSTVERSSGAFNLVFTTIEEMEEAPTERELQKTLRHCLVGLRKLFEDGKAWPTDIIKSGENLLHVRKAVSDSSVRNVGADWAPGCLLWTHTVFCR